MRIRNRYRKSGKTLEIAMKQLLPVSSALALLFGLTALAVAGDFDGTQPVWIPAATTNGYLGLTFDW